MRAYAFYFNNLEGPFNNGAAVVVEGNVQGARKRLIRKFRRDQIPAVMIETTSPGPYWTKLARKTTRPRVVYFRDGLN